jgi:hypothetical protein
VAATPVTPKAKVAPQDPGTSKAMIDQLKTSAPLAQGSTDTANESHDEADDAAKLPRMTPQSKEDVDDAPTKKVPLDPSNPSKTTNVGTDLNPQ